MGASDTHRTIEAVWRIESARLIAGFARLVRDVGLAEELAQDALVAALEQWTHRAWPGGIGIGAGRDAATATREDTPQAAIAGCHARARSAGETDWVRIAALYDELVRLEPTPIVRLN